MARLLVIILFLGLVIYLIAQSIINNIVLDVKLKKIDVGESFISILQGKGELKTTIEILIENQNRFSIPLSNLDIDIYYENILIANTDKVDSSKVVIPKQGYEKFTHKINVFLVQSFFDVVSKLKEGDKITLEYVLKVKIFGIPVRIPLFGKAKFEYIKE